MDQGNSSVTGLKFSVDDRCFSDIISFEYVCHAAICSRLTNIPAFDPTSDHHMLRRSNVYAACAKELNDVTLDDLGSWPSEDILELRYLVFTIIDNMFFFQHSTCKIGDKYVQCCCEEHKFRYGYELACQSFESLIRHPAFEFENCFSIFQLLRELKIHLVIQRATSLEELHRLARTVLEREVVLMENEPSTEAGIFSTIFAKDYLGNCSNQCESFLAVKEDDFSSVIQKLKRKYCVEEFEIHLRNFLRNFYSRLPEPFIFGVGHPEEDEAEEPVKEAVNEHSTEIPESKPLQPQPEECENANVMQPADPRHETPTKGREIPRTPPMANEPATEKETELTFSESLVIDPKALLEIYPKYASNYTELVLGTHPNIQKFLQSINTNVENNVVASTSEKHSLELEKSPKKAKIEGRNRFSPEEVEYLIEGVQRFGNNWRRILESYPFASCRTNVDLKDKVRNLRRAGKMP